jgi:hypothetical protein
MVSRILAWIVGRLRLLLLVATGIGVVLVYMGWTDGARIRDLQVNGVEATANIESATRTKGRRSGESFSLKLSWRDANGAVLTTDRVSVSNAFAHRIIRDGRIMVGTVRIKYLPNGSDTTPIVLDDAAHQAETDDFMLKAGMGLAGGCGLASLLMFLLARRRRDTVASAPAR